MTASAATYRATCEYIYIEIGATIKLGIQRKKFCHKTLTRLQIGHPSPNILIVKLTW